MKRVVPNGSFFSVWVADSAASAASTFSNNYYYGIVTALALSVGYLES